MMNTVDIFTHPLKCPTLIEASAGTGKTYTISNLYLRLLLGLGCEPLAVEQILVVTFTVAATEELRDRIRKNIRSCRDYFSRWYKAEKYQAERLQEESEGADDLAELLEQYEKDQQNKELAYFLNLYNATKAKDINEAILRLRIAEREIDLASIFTIHSFCQKMLFQFAFDSGMRFDLDLQPDESRLLKRLSEETWRELFYPMDLAQTAIVAKTLKTPADTLAQLRPYLKLDLPPLETEQQWVASEMSELSRYAQFINEVKAHWRANREAITGAIYDDVMKDKDRALNGNKYRKDSTLSRIHYLNTWSESQSDCDLPEEDFLRFCENYLLEGGIKKNAHFPLNEHFAKNQAFLTAYQTQFKGKQKALLLFQFLQKLRQKLQAYKASHSEKSFDDLLIELNTALKGKQGKALAAQIRHQFGFAMIDEFQDTDIQQYEIFSQIFMADKENPHGFVMIGDPKQSIYKFRGADIFTYLQAANEVLPEHRFTLGKNWRSLPNVVTACNQLFHFPENSSPFLYEKIGFPLVESKDSEENLRGGENVVCYLQSEFDEKLAAKQTAYQIQQQLKQMQAGEFTAKNTLKAEDIAILVRTGNQAELMKTALAECGIKSVYYSDRSSVYASEVAQDLLWILRACQQPYQANAVLAALGCSVWGLTASQISHYKNDEKAWDQLIEKWVHYQQVWQQQGVLPMLHRIFLQEGILKRMKGLQNAERRMTDLLHLTELLQEKSAELETEIALVRWYEKQIQAPEQNDAHKLRLESEEKLVKIITIHGSKGLEYPIVWLPFIGKNNRGASSKMLDIYRDEQGKPRWYLGEMDDSEESQAVKMALSKEEFAEDLRLLYVAVTRAKLQLNLVLPQTFAKGWNAIHYLLCNGEMGCRTDFDTQTPTASYFQQKGIACQFVELADNVPEDSWRPNEDELTAPEFPIFDGEVRSDTGRITSFTSLHSYHEHSQAGADIAESNRIWQDIGRDYDASEGVFSADSNDENHEFSPYQFPKGTKAGTALHKFFEDCDFTQAVKNEDISAIIDTLKLSEEWQEPLQQWIEQVLITPFGTEDKPFCLRDIEPAKCLNEWEFYMRLVNETALPKLNRLLKAYSPLAEQLPALQLPQLNGFIRGFVDCIANVNGKFYILDYKSNFLGNLAQDYSPTNLAKAMGQYRYDLQYLLYTLAFHRYLRSRLGEHYDYERDFGGVAYLFLRGMNGEPNSGVFFDKPSKILIEEMDLLFG